MPEDDDLEITKIEVTISKKIPIPRIAYSSQQASATIAAEKRLGEKTGKTVGAVYDQLFKMAEQVVDKKLREMNQD